MKRLLVVLALLWATPTLAADRSNWFSTRGVRQFGRALTDGGLFGVPRYTTALLPTCDTKQTGAVVFDTTASTLKGCDGSAWAAIGGFTGGTVSNATVFTSTVAFGASLGAANSWAAGVTAGSLTFEGATADDFEATLTPGDPGADYTLTLPNSATTLAGLAIAQTFSAANVFSAQATFGTAAAAANAIDLNETAGCITFEGSSADTIQARLCATNPTTGDRTFNIPLVAAAGTSTLVTLESPQTFSGNNTHSGTLTMTGPLVINSDVNHSYGSGSALQFQFDTANTPDTMKFGTGTASNSITITESADISNDSNNGPCGTAACTHPTLNVRSATGATTADYSSLSYGGIAGKSVKTLVDATATDTVKVSIAAEAGTAGEYLVTVYATDGSTPQVRQVRVLFSATNDGGTTTCTLGTPETVDHTPTGTLTATITCIDGTAAATLQVNATSSLTETTLEAYSQVILSGPGAILPQ